MVNKDNISRVVMTITNIILLITSLLMINKVIFNQWNNSDVFFLFVGILEMAMIILQIGSLKYRGIVVVSIMNASANLALYQISGVSYLFKLSLVVVLISIFYMIKFARKTPY